MTAMIGTQMYPWTQYRQRAGTTLEETLSEAFRQADAAGLQAWEHCVVHGDEIASLRQLADDVGLALPSVYAGSVLHDASRVPAELDRLDGLAEALAQHGIPRLTTNPDPIAWGRDDDKDDAQLRTQADALIELVRRCDRHGITLAYHAHAAEFRAGAREFHHMMLAVPEMRLCLDPHWIYRGCGNSNLAVLDVLRLYADRVASLHLRQSRDHVWTQTLGDGDIRHAPIFDELDAQGFDGPVYLELATEDDTDVTLDVVETHRASAAWVREQWR
jgi:inosose dehydratase